MKKFEYLYVACFGGDKVEKTLNTAGFLGWELINFTKDELGKFSFIFRRELIIPNTEKK